MQSHQLVDVVVHSEMQQLLDGCPTVWHRHPWSLWTSDFLSNTVINTLFYVSYRQISLLRALQPHCLTDAWGPIRQWAVSLPPPLFLMSTGQLLSKRAKVVSWTCMAIDLYYNKYISELYTSSAMNKHINENKKRSWSTTSLTAHPVNRLFYVSTASLIVLILIM